MKETFVLIASVIGFLTVVLGLIKAIIEFRTTRMKNEIAVTATRSVRGESQKAEQSQASHIPEVTAIRKLIDKAWTRVSWGCAGAMISFLMSFLTSGLHPDVRGLWWEIASYGMMGCGLLYLLMAFLSGRRAVRLHEAVGGLEIIEVFPPILAHFREHVREREQASTEPNKAPEPTPGAVTPRATEGDLR